MTAGWSRLAGVIFNTSGLASRITQDCIAMVSLPVHVAGLQEAARRLKGSINHLDSSHTASQILPLKLFQRQQTNATEIHIKGGFKVRIVKCVLISSE